MPITAIVLLLSFTLAPEMPVGTLVMFLLGAILLIVGMVAMTPLVTIQCLGAVYQWKLRRTVEVTEDEASTMSSEDIIEFDDV